MNKKSLEYFKCLGLTPDDVKNILEISPEITDLDDKQIIGNIELVISFGYPKIDMGSFIQVNPTFLLLDSDTLKQILESLDDVEESLKNDPFLI